MYMVPLILYILKGLAQIESSLVMSNSNPAHLINNLSFELYDFESSYFNLVQVNPDRVRVKHWSYSSFITISLKI